MKNLEFLEDGLIKFNYDFPVFNWFYPYEADKITDLNILNEIAEKNINIFDYLSDKNGDTALYFHTPFCQDICAFCPFTREILKDDNKLELYVDCILKEIDLKKEFINSKKLEINSIFFGGGTPSILTAEQIEKIGLKIQSSFNLQKLKEFSFEMNAKTITKEKAEILKKVGVTHVRIGVQTFSSKYRKLFCLTATLEQIKEGIKILKNYFKNISIDIMYGFNGQTIYEFLTDLRKAIELDVPNISLYPLNNKSIQKRLIDSYKKENLKAVTGLDRIGFKILAKEYMSYNGYYPHNGHDFVKIKQKIKKEEFMTKEYMFEYHRTVYGTEHSQLIGFGVGAISFFNGFITMNENNIDKYINDLKENQNYRMIIRTYDKQLDIDKSIRLYLPYHGNILKEKVDLNRISSEVIKKLEILKKLNLIEENEKEYKLTFSGWLNYVNILYFLSPKDDQKLLIEQILECEKVRDIGEWNFEF